MMVRNRTTASSPKPGEPRIENMAPVHSMTMDVERALTYKISLFENVVFKTISPAMT